MRFLRHIFKSCNRTLRQSKGDAYENCFSNCALYAWTCVYSLWPERILQLHPSATADEPICDPVLRRHQCLTFAAFFFAVQLIGGLLLLSGFFVPLALTLLAAELYNILAFHLTLAPESIAPALVASVLWALIFMQYRASFKDLLAVRPAVQE
jgi:hypothetical protein